MIRLGAQGRQAKVMDLQEAEICTRSHFLWPMQGKITYPDAGVADFRGQGYRSLALGFTIGVG
jgi:hypothetical protein